MFGNKTKKYSIVIVSILLILLAHLLGFLWFYPINNGKILQISQHLNVNLFMYKKDINTTQMRGIKTNNHTNIDLSIVVATRNDNHSSNPISRLKLFLNQFIMYEWKKLHKLNVEVNVIEWNYVENNPHVNEYDDIIELLEYNKIHQNAIIKFYKIPPKYNDTKNCSERYNIKCPFPQYYPKNIGIRRSNGEWILITNMDDVFSIKLMDLIGYHISNKSLDINGVYQAQWDERNYTQIIANHSKFSLINTIYDKNNNFPMDKCIAKLDATNGGLMGWSGDFTLLNRYHVFNHYVGGYLEHCSSQSLDSEFVMRQIHINGLQPYKIVHKCSYVHIQHDRTPPKNNICYKRFTGYLYKFNFINKTLTNYNRYVWALGQNVSWDDAYKISNQTWGMKNITFNYDMY